MCCHTLDTELMHIGTVARLGHNLDCASQIECSILGAHTKVTDIAAQVPAASCSSTAQAENTTYR